MKTTISIDDLNIILEDLYAKIPPKSIFDRTNFYVFPLHEFIYLPHVQHNTNNETFTISDCDEHLTKRQKRRLRGKKRATKQKFSRINTSFVGIAFVKQGCDLPQIIAIQTQYSPSDIMSVIDPSWKTDCSYFSDNHYLNCAVNTSCTECRDYEPRTRN
ncbi:hypothetical protein PCC6912_39720 [Chlorogloeopsis fritschii PCC 6912]|uniref:Uncharacterized protein n=1 Tax=Chlorogloeopsis fritschii PCC 6912 TaxID=211165 RepID=A0A433N6A3_CHLFR|nr:hypothetical protein [Chlorogloeopsis fritschii]RUR77013.1 hypothetical protein PCC6912_39720 [Chlorogloeopsis fritschii PCC 6912]